MREAARALTGFRGHWYDGRLPRELRPSLHDRGVNASSATAGASGWRDVLDLAVAPPAPRRLPRREAVGLLRRRAARPRDPARAGPRPTSAPGTASRRSSRDPRPPGALRATSAPRRWSRRRSCRSPGRCGPRARRRHRRLGLDLRPDGPDALPPAVRGRLGLGPGLDVDDDDARPLHARPTGSEGRAREGVEGGATPAWTAAQPSSAPAARRGSRGPRRHRARLLALAADF